MLRNFRLVVFLILAVFVSLGAHAAGSEINVAAASDLKFALSAIVRAYESQYPGEKVQLSFGSSGKFAAQILNGAPFDLFFSADTEHAQKVVSAGRAKGDVFPYAQGHLVVWVRNESKVTLDSKLKCLLDNSVKKIAVANPTLAPYGKTAEAALAKTGLKEKIVAKLVTGENIAQAAQYVESGAADLGLIAKSIALSEQLKSKGRFIEVESSLYPPLIQSGVVLKTAKIAASEKFRTYFLGEKGRKIMNEFGLTPAVLLASK